jgi:hypothetical protein
MGLLLSTSALWPLCRAVAQRLQRRELARLCSVCQRTNDLARMLQMNACWTAGGVAPLLSSVFKQGGLPSLRRVVQLFKPGQDARYLLFLRSFGGRDLELVKSLASILELDNTSVGRAQKLEFLQKAVEKQDIELTRYIFARFPASRNQVRKIYQDTSMHSGSARDWLASTCFGNKK